MLLDVSQFLGVEYLCYKVCGRGGKSFKEYLNASNLGYCDVTADMDIVRFIRRLRIHGVGLNYLLSKT